MREFEDIVKHAVRTDQFNSENFQNATTAQKLEHIPTQMLRIMVRESRRGICVWRPNQLRLNRKIQLHFDQAMAEQHSGN